MSIQEEAERLRAIASSEYLPIEDTRSLQSRLLDINTAVVNILGQTQRAQDIINLIQAAAETYSTVIAALQQVESAIHDAADHHQNG